MISVDETNRSKFKCKRPADSEPIFFSLVDYRNSLFLSNDPNKVMEFYNGFSHRDQLIQWMRERPKGVYTIHEVDGSKEVIVVIPTADFNGEYARNCRENIFKGLHIIFVESGINNPYFNGAHNVNAGIKKAIEYNPKWIVFSGDDMLKIDGIEKLVYSLRKLNNQEIDCVFTNPGKYHSTEQILGMPNIIFLVSLFLGRFFSKDLGYVYKIYTVMKKFSSDIYIPRNRNGIKNFIVNHIYFYKRLAFVNILSFGVFSSNFIKKRGNRLFDNIYINEMEDTDLSISLLMERNRTVIVDYKIDEFVGASLGRGILRTLKVFTGYTYFSYKVTNGMIKL